MFATAKKIIIIIANKKKKATQKQKYEFVPISMLAKLAGVTRQAPRYWIETGYDNKGRKLQYRVEFGRIFISTFHAS